jgi:hypothetical protein
MNFYQVAMTVADIHGWPQSTLANKVGIDYNSIRNWRRRKSTTQAEFNSLWKGLGISPSDLALAASLSDDMMLKELAAHRQKSGAVASPAIEWALEHFGSMDRIVEAVNLQNNKLQRSYIVKVVALRKAT